MYSIINKPSSKDVIARMRKAYGVEQDAELAKKLEVSKQAVYNWYQSKTGVPVQYTQKCREDCNISLDYLYYGERNEVYETAAGYTVNTNELSQRAQSLTDAQQLAIAKMLESVENLIVQFESENEKNRVIKEMSERLSQLEKDTKNKR